MGFQGLLDTMISNNTTVLNTFFFLWRLFRNGCFQKLWSTPKWMVKITENPIKMEDLGVPLFMETPKYKVENHQQCSELAGANKSNKAISRFIWADELRLWWCGRGSRLPTTRCAWAKLWIFGDFHRNPWLSWQMHWMPLRIFEPWHRNIFPSTYITWLHQLGGWVPLKKGNSWFQRKLLVSERVRPCEGMFLSV